MVLLSEKCRGSGSGAETLKVEPAIVHAFELANKAAMTPQELEDQERREIYIQDQRGAIQLAEQRGRSAGRAEGRVEGRVEERREMVLQANRSGMTSEDIAKMFEMD